MHILVIGSSGFLGSNITAALAKEHAVSCATLEQDKSENNLSWYYCDVTDKESFDHLPSNIDAVYYTVMSTEDRGTSGNRRLMWDVNVNGLLNALEYAQRVKAQKFVVLSSGNVYKPKATPYKECDTLIIGSEYSFYSSTKLAAEALLGAYSPFFSICCLRLFYPYGNSSTNALLFSRLAKKIYREETITLNRDDGIFMNPIFIDDAVNACISGLLLNGFNIINVAGPETVSLGHICRIIGKHLDIAPRLVTQGAQDSCVADITKMRELLCSPLIGIEEGIELTLASWKDAF